MRIVWMGAGDIGLPSLQWLIKDSGHEVVGAFTQPDRPVGRKQILTATAIKTLSIEQNVPVFQPESFRGNPEALSDLQQLAPDLIVVMAYGCLLPQEVIDTPVIACINLHASLLPRHRGAAPIHAAILAGDDETGITVMHIAKKLDAGDMIWKEKISISADETGGVLHDRLAEVGPKALAASLPLLQNGSAAREVQDETEMTHTGKLGREDGVIDWSRSAIEIERQVRAFDPWPGTGTMIALPEGKTRRLKIFPPVEIDDLYGSEETELTGLPSGSVLPSRDPSEQGLRVMTGDGVLRLFQVQMEGRSRMDVSGFLRGNPLPEGARFGEKPST